MTEGEYQAIDHDFGKPEDESDLPAKKLTRDERYFQRVGRAKTPSEMDLAMRRGRWEVGDRATFPNGSSSSGRRSGVIVACGPVRARIKFTYKNGRESERTIPYPLLRRF